MASVFAVLLLALPRASAFASPRTLSPRMLSPRMVTDRRVASVPTDPFVREAEIKHGRVAMTAAGVLAALAAHGVSNPTSALNDLPAHEQLLFFASVGALEAGTYLPRVRSFGRLADGVTPGRFLPADFPPPPTLAVRCEDAAGRLAMCCVLPFMVHDLLT